jgi:hypothetical protein
LAEAHKPVGVAVLNATGCPEMILLFEGMSLYYSTKFLSIITHEWDYFSLLLSDQGDCHCSILCTITLNVKYVIYYIFISTGTKMQHFGEMNNFPADISPRSGLDMPLLPELGVPCGSLATDMPLLPELFMLR